MPTLQAFVISDRVNARRAGQAIAKRDSASASISAANGSLLRPDDAALEPTQIAPDFYIPAAKQRQPPRHGFTRFCRAPRLVE